MKTSLACIIIEQARVPEIGTLVLNFLYTGSKYLLLPNLHVDSFRHEYEPEFVTRNELSAPLMLQAHVLFFKVYIDSSMLHLRGLFIDDVTGILVYIMTVDFA